MRSTNSAPLALSNSYLTGSPPVGTSMMTFRLSGGLSPTGMCSICMDARFRGWERHPSLVFGRALDDGAAIGETRIARPDQLGHPAAQTWRGRFDARRFGHRIRPP